MSRLGACALLLLLALPVGPLGAQARAQPAPQTGRAEELVVHAYTLKYQKATEALMLIHSLLSPRGTVELQAGGNTLVVRDTVASLAKVVAVLRNFDHPAVPLRLELYVVRASRRSSVSGQPAAAKLPAELVRRLKGILPYEVYDLEGKARLSTAEGETVTYDIGSDLEVGFRLGALSGEQIRLNGFRILRRQGTQRTPRQLFQSDLTVSLDQPTTVGLTRSEASSDALMLVLTLHRDLARVQRVQD